jgi:hypothetical protein
VLAVVIGLIRQGKFVEAIELFSQHPELVNGIETESTKSILMIAISQTTKNAADLPTLLEYFLSHAAFDTVNYVNPDTEETAFDMVLREPVPPAVIDNFIEYYKQHHAVQQAALKYALAYKYYQRAIEKRNTGKISDLELARYRDIKELLRVCAIEHAVATEQPEILTRIQATGELIILDYPDGTTSYDRASAQLQAHYDQLLGVLN